MARRHPLRPAAFADLPGFAEQPPAEREILLRQHDARAAAGRGQGGD